jgi:hypothetical protein
MNFRELTELATATLKHDTRAMVTLAAHYERRAGGDNRRDDKRTLTGRDRRKGRKTSI